MPNIGQKCGAKYKFTSHKDVNWHDNFRKLALLKPNKCILWLQFIYINVHTCAPKDLLKNVYGALLVLILNWKMPEHPSIGRWMKWDILIPGTITKQ